VVVTDYLESLTVMSHQVEKQFILHLYRSILQEGKKMPTQNRRDFIKMKARKEFKLAKTEKDPIKIIENVALAETLLEAVQVQQQHLNEFFSTYGDASELTQDFKTGLLLEKKPNVKKDDSFKKKKISFTLKKIIFNKFLAKL